MKSRIILFLTIFAIYLYTIPPTIFFEDSGEMASISYFLGIPHGSGYVPFVLIGKLFTFIPVFDIAFRINLLSAFLGALKSLLFFQLFYILFKDKLESKKLILASYFATFCFSFSYSGWYFTTVHGDKFALMFVIAILSFILALEYLKDKFYPILLLPSLIGFGLITHPTFLLLVPIILFIIFTKKPNYNLIRIMPIFIFLFLISLSLQIMMPLRSAANPPFKDGDFSNPIEFKNSVLRSDSYLFMLPKKSIEQIKEYLFDKKYFLGVGSEPEDIWGRIFISKFLLLILLSIHSLFKEFGVFIIFALFGLIHLFLTDKRIFLFLSLWLFLYFVTPFLILSPPLCEKGFIQFWNNLKIIPLSLFLGASFIFFLDYLVQKNRYISNLFLIIIFIVPILIFINHFNLFNKSKDYIAYNFGKNTLLNLPPNTLLLVNGDDIYVLFRYFQTVERIRNDILVLGKQRVDLPYIRKKLLEKGVIKKEFGYRPTYEYEDEIAALYGISRYFLKIIELNLLKRPIYVIHKPVMYFYVKGKKIPTNICIPIRKKEDFKIDEFARE